MGDVSTLVADPEFQALDPATKRSALSRVDPEFGKLSDQDFQSFLSRSAPLPASPSPIGIRPQTPWESIASRISEFAHDPLGTLAEGVPGTEEFSGAGSSLSRFALGGIAPGGATLREFQALPASKGLARLTDLPGKLIQAYRNASGAGDAASAVRGAQASPGRVWDTPPVWHNPTIQPVDLQSVPDPTVAPQPRPATAPAAPLPPPKRWSPPIDLKPADIPIIPHRDVAPQPRPATAPAAPIPPVQRTPLWSHIPQSELPTPTDLSAIPGVLPSGRIPGAPAFDSATGEIIPSGTPVTEREIQPIEIPGDYEGLSDYLGKHKNPTAALALDKETAAHLQKDPTFDPDKMTLDQVNAARKIIRPNGKPITAADWETRKAQLRKRFQ